MNTRICILSICFWGFIILSCNDTKKEVEGAWGVNSNSIEGAMPSKFKAMFLYNSPVDYTEKVYLSDSLIEYPLGFYRKGSWPEQNFIPYQVNGDKIVIADDTVDFKLRRGSLCVENQCFFKSISDSGMKLQYFDLQIAYKRELSLGFKLEESGEFELYHSKFGKSTYGVFTSETIDYLKNLASRINVEQLNRIYNVGISHEAEYKLFLVLDNETFVVETFGLADELPFEVRAFIHNLIKAIEKEIER